VGPPLRDKNALREKPFKTPFKELSLTTAMEGIECGKRQRDAEKPPAKVKGRDLT
jgi:hypothetical protein